MGNHPQTKQKSVALSHATPSAKAWVPAAEFTAEALAKIADRSGPRENERLEYIERNT